MNDSQNKAALTAADLEREKGVTAMGKAKKPVKK
jgi:hypothetical protein